jgi:hypothetical protein
MDFVGKSAPLSSDGFDAAMDTLGTRAGEVWAVLSVETAGCGFFADRRPQLLFERHLFHRKTNGAFDATHPAISSLVPGGYLGGPREFDRLAEAAALDRRAALESASWGIGQVMGGNAAIAGFVDVESMVAATVDGEDAQLSAAAAFIAAEGLGVPLAAHDWAAFARGYNGPGFMKNQYDVRLAGAFAGFSAGVMPDLAVRRAQVLLLFAGIDPGRIDGINGKRTRSAAARFRKLEGLPVSDEIDADLLAALEAGLH